MFQTNVQVVWSLPEYVVLHTRTPPKREHNNLVRGRRTDNIQDWPRHRRECVPARNHNIVAIPSPAEQHPNMIIVSAILFAPEEGMALPEPLYVPTLDCITSQNSLG